MPLKTIDLIIDLYEKTKAPTILFDENLVYIWANEQASKKYPFLKTHSGITSILTDEEKKEILENIYKNDFSDKDELNTLDERWEYMYNVKTPFSPPMTLHFTVFKAPDNTVFYVCSISTQLNIKTNNNKANVFSLPSYHIREPLFYIFAALDSLKILLDQESHEINTDSINTYINSISTNSYKILRVITNINKYLKLLNSIEVGEDDNKEVFYLNRFVSDICHSVHLTTIDNQTPFYYNISDTDMVVNMSVDTLITVILHLISNSFIYTKEGNKVSLSLKKEENFAVITVTDHGVGINKKNLKNIFTPFHGNNSTITETQGIGLGLTISKFLATNDGGDLSVKSFVNSGTVVSYKIPLMSNIKTKVITLNQNDSNLVSNKFSKIYVELAGFSKPPLGGQNAETT